MMDEASGLLLQKFSFFTTMSPDSRPTPAFSSMGHCWPTTIRAPPLVLSRGVMGYSMRNCTTPRGERSRRGVYPLHVRVRTPCAVPSINTSAGRYAKMPFVTTPGMLLSSASSLAGSLSF